MLMKSLRKAVLGVLLLPYITFGAGMFSNQAVLIANHSKFPVRVQDSWFIAYGNPVVAEGETIDAVHSRMTDDDHLKLLADIFVFGPRILSIGDLLMDAGAWMTSYSPVIALCLFAFKKVDTGTAKA